MDQQQIAANPAANAVPGGALGQARRAGGVHVVECLQGILGDGG